MERRKLDRRNFSYYMRVMNDTNGELVGHLADISTGGFKLEVQKPIPLNMDYKLRIDLTGEVSDKSFITFIARTKWCQPDHIDPTSYNVGFQLISITPGDLDIFSRMFDKYGTKNKDSNADYLWK